MAYKLKYYKELQSQGHLWRLEIHQYREDSIPLFVMQIGPVLQGLRLIVQGDQADIDTPIVKTSLEMTFVEAADLEPGSLARKNGGWEEFYTSSATEYKVILKKDGVAEWSGYITPDSFRESLQYRGSVTIIARDNLGALQDYEYDHLTDSNGMVSLLDILSNGLDKVSFPMEWSYSHDGVRRISSCLDADINTNRAYEILFNNESFKERTWLEAVETALQSCGMVLRYVGGNRFMLASIRDIPLYDADYWWDVPVLPAIFCAYGQRELTPAVKTLIDEINFEIEENFASVDMPADAYGAAGEYEILTDSANLAENPLKYPMPIHAVVGGSWTARSVDQSLFLNPFAFPLKDGHSSKKIGDLRDDSVVYLAANNNAGTSSGRSAEWKMKVGPGKYNFSFTVGHPVALYDDNTKIGYIDLDMSFSRIVYRLRFISAGGSEVHEYRSSSNEWIDNLVTDPNSGFPNVDFPATLEFPTLEVSAIGEIVLEVMYVGAVKKLSSPSGESKGAYLPFKEFTMTDAALENTVIPGHQKVTTKYNAKNNILIKRSLDYGFNDSDVASPHIINNGLFIERDSWYESSDQWAFNAADTPQPLPVLMHQQLLPYYAQPNNVLTGELATVEPRFNALYEWNGVKHMLVSGVLNVISGRMENVVLRQFMRYDHMWETWAEVEDVVVGNGATQVELRMHTNRDVVFVENAPLWMLVAYSRESQDTVIVTLSIDANDAQKARSAILKIGSALVRVTQSEDSDFNIDFNNDFK